MIHKKQQSIMSQLGWNFFDCFSPEAEINNLHMILSMMISYGYLHIKDQKSVYDKRLWL
jgi:hypothetical protein